MEKIADLLRKIKFHISLISLAVIMIAWAYLQWTIKEIILDIASFDKYITFSETPIEVYNATTNWISIKYDSTTNRVVNFNRSYSINSDWELSCWIDWEFSWRGNKKAVRVVDSKSNPSIIFNWTVREWVEVEKWEECYIRYNLSLNNWHENKYKDIETNVFIVN